MLEFVNFDGQAIEYLTSLFKQNGIYYALTLEGISNIIAELKTICDEVESLGFEKFAKKYAPEDADAFFAENADKDYGLALMMYRSTLALYENIYAEKLKEGR